MKYDAVVVASGKGKRADLGYNKVFYVMNNGKTVLENACHLFIEDEDCQRVIVVCPDEVFKHEKVVRVDGGAERTDSVRNGLMQAKENYVLIHDGARPYLDKESLENVKNTLKECDGCILAHKEINTLKKVTDGKITATIDRKDVWCAETPQAFKTPLIKKAYAECTGVFTDDISLLENGNYDIRVVENRHDNHKMTEKKDFL